MTQRSTPSSSIEWASPRQNPAPIGSPQNLPSSSQQHPFTSTSLHCIALKVESSMTSLLNHPWLNPPFVLPEVFFNHVSSKSRLARLKVHTAACSSTSQISASVFSNGVQRASQQFHNHE